MLGRRSAWSASTIASRWRVQEELGQRCELRATRLAQQVSVNQLTARHSALYRQALRRPSGRHNDFTLAKGGGQSPHSSPQSTRTPTPHRHTQCRAAL